MTHQVRRFASIALWALPIWAALLFAGTVTHQPDPQTNYAGFAAYVTSSVFLWSHLIASILGAALGSVGVIALMLYLQDSPVFIKAAIAMLATVAGNTLTSSIFGVAAFGQPAMGRMFLSGAQNAPDFYNQVYGIPLFGTAMVSLLLFIVGGIYAGIAITSSHRFPRWTGWVYAIAAPLFALSNFLMPVGQSVASLLLTVATLVVAVTALREERGGEAKAEIPA